MLLQINKLNDVKEYVAAAAAAAERKTSSRREDQEPTPVKSALKNGNGNGNGHSNHFASSLSEPVSKKAKTGASDLGSDDFIAFSSNADGYSSNTSNKSKAAAKESAVRGQSDAVQQNSKIAISKLAKENAARRSLVQNPCTYFSDGTYVCVFWDETLNFILTLFVFPLLQWEAVEMVTAAS